MNIKIVVALVLTLTSFQALCADIAREVVTSSDRSDAYAEFSLSVGVFKLPLIGFNDEEDIEKSDDTTTDLTLALDARFRYKRFFIDVVQDSFNNLALGLVLANSDQGSTELVLVNVFDDIERDAIVGFESITQRDSDANLGFRSSMYRGNNIFQIELMGDVSDSHKGVMGALHLGRQKQIRNWNLHALLGFRYFSDRVIDHYFGVSTDEATELLPEYKADAGLLPSLELGATLPLNEKWLFKTRARYHSLPESVVDSPLAQGDDFYFANLSVAYVFGGHSPCRLMKLN